MKTRYTTSIEQNKLITDNIELIYNTARRLCKYYRQPVDVLNADTGEIVDTLKPRRKRKTYAFDRTPVRIMCHPDDRDSILDDADGHNDARKQGTQIPRLTYTPIPKTTVYSFPRVSVVCMLHDADAETFKESTKWYTENRIRDQPTAPATPPKRPRVTVTFLIHVDDRGSALVRASQLNKARKDDKPLPPEVHTGTRGTRYGFERVSTSVSVDTDDVAAFKNTVQALSAKRIVTPYTKFTTMAHPDDHDDILSYVQSLTAMRN